MIAEKDRNDVIRCPKCGRNVDSLRCGHCGSQLPDWQSDLYGAAIRQIAKLGGNRADNGSQGGEPEAGKEDPQDSNPEPKDNGGASTPQWLFDRCNELAIEICGEPMSLDVAAAPWNHKCDRYFTEEDDALKQAWDAKAVWCNPPYSATIIEAFIRKAIDVSGSGTITACLLPWWNYSYLDLCEQHGRIHRISCPVTFRREDGSTLTLNNGFRSTPLVVAIFGPTITSGFGTPIKKSASLTTAQDKPPEEINSDEHECSVAPPSGLRPSLPIEERVALLRAGKQSPEHGIIYTPAQVADFLYSLLSPLHPEIVLDVASGNGDLSRPWCASAKVVEYELAFDKDFFECSDRIDADLVLCNPPFGQEKEFLRRILEVVPSSTPIALFATHRVRLGSYATSTDWRWCRDEWPTVSSIVSLPRGIFKGVNETVEILIFRTRHLAPHYFLPEAADIEESDCPPAPAPFALEEVEEWKGRKLTEVEEAVRRFFEDKSWWVGGPIPLCLLYESSSLSVFAETNALQGDHRVDKEQLTNEMVSRGIDQRYHDGLIVLYQRLCLCPTSPTEYAGLAL